MSSDHRFFCRQFDFDLSPELNADNQTEYVY